MVWVLAVAGAVAAVLLFLFVRGELARRKKWFLDARAALGESFAPFARRPSTDLEESAGKLDGRESVFAADATTTEARLEVPLREGIERGRVFDLIVRDQGGAAETGREDVLAGWDDEHGRIVFRARCERDAAITVKVLIDEARAFQARLPEILELHRKVRAELGARTFGEITAPNGRHALLGLALTLPPEEWERTRERPELVEWELLPREGTDDLPVELRLIPVPTAPPLENEEPRLALIERIAQSDVIDRLPDGSFDGPAPDAHGKPGPPVSGFPTVVAPVDHAREVVVGGGPDDDDETSAVKPYRTLVHGVFTPWAVSVLELVAPRERADALLEKLLEGASFEKPTGGRGAEPREKK
jgi:hypothetical protein